MYAEYKFNLEKNVDKIKIFLMLTHNVGKKFTQFDGGKGPKLQLDLCSVEYCANFTLV